MTSIARKSEVGTRILMGSILAFLAACVLVGDWLFESETGLRLYPCLLVCVLGMATLAAIELNSLLAERQRPPIWLTAGGCVCVLLAAWRAHFTLDRGWGDVRHDLLHDVLVVFVAFFLIAFLYEIIRFHEPDGCVARLATATFAVAYLGMLPAFLVDLRWWEGDILQGPTALTLVIFVPKCCDIGAYFTGRAFGRHRMTPMLSPKKTWEGLAGGVALSMLVAVGINRAMAPILGEDWRAAAFGVVVGLAGVLGDLAESMLKRDGNKKDAATMLPGFGGVLDVIDSILFAAPVAWVWLRG